MLHDAHEGVIGDITSPVCDWIEALAGRAVVAEIRACIDPHVHEALGLRWPRPPAVTRAIDMADAMMAATEIRDTVEDVHDVVPAKAKPCRQPIETCWPWQRAEEKWLERYYQLRPLAGGA